MSAAPPPPDSAAFCADLVRSHDFPRYAATLFAPAAERRALLALYAFNVEIVRVRDQVSQPLPGEIRLQWWTDMLSGHVHGSAEGNPVAAELLRAIRDFDLPVEPLSLLADEHQFDLYNDPMPTMAALEGYLAATSSALLMLAARIMGAPSDVAEHLARHAGLAQGIVQIIANLPRDAARRQLFVPQQVLASHGCSMEDVFAGKETPSLRAVLDQLAGEAQQHVTTALSLLAQLPPSVRPAFLPLSQAQADLKRLSQPGRNPFAPQPPSRLRTLWTLWRASRSREFTK
ncbi:phytoene/squalene synthase family protein [Bradyrhizobium sp. CB1717]|uniref:phytoene/squalene synthase family protein n=1 Tax=Bradyrhizobium sp. CB1717 TaxID=3039154 RepID=UPI0024B166C6|nr:phytoene/squalene synthase family protein [Bradyrhizobium sp. CB1717]WFU20991.1 phytoene/squalene synthase family protein [Bradyrhizobium sp. CB1717]